MTFMNASRVAVRTGRLLLPIALFASAALGLGACTKAREASPSSTTQPMVVSVQTHAIAGPSNAALRLAALKAARGLGGIEVHGRRVNPSSLSGDVLLETAQPAISGDVVFTRDRILGRAFLYGCDLQYSAMPDQELGLILQSMALGHIPAKFQVVGDRLQLIADQTSQFESNVNHPGRLLHEWPIVAQDTTTITVRIRHASPILATVIGGPKASANRSDWVRSVEFVSQGDYLMVESSVEQGDGSIVEFMESVFPRETIVKADAKPLIADATLEPLAERYRFLGGDAIFLDLPEGRLKTKVASRFAVDPATTMIDWYVTPNIPAEYLPLIQAGVEGWNRYSQKMWGRDFMKFKGVLPAGVKLGDPRYNVINWDSVAEAGAAYESQASDPLTGVQSHSLIYLPFAWINIGKEYWKNGDLTQNEKSAEVMKKALAQGSFFGKPLEVRCFHEVAAQVSLNARRTPEEFAAELLKQVLFHEVGHALGLAHNFKGSLSFDPTKPGAMFSTSIMDYNQYQLEDTAYESPTSSNGPLLEYDRQILSVLYNEGKDVAATDSVVPACADEEADSETNKLTGETGVDPLCIRYDAGEDPTKQLLRTIELTRDANLTLGRVKSFPTSILETTAILGDPAKITNQKELEEASTKFATELKGVTGYYFAAGAQSLSYMMRANLKSLYVFREGVLPSGMDEAAMRDRVATSLNYVSGLEAFEPAAQQALTKILADYSTWLNATGWAQGLAADQKGTTVAAQVTKINTFVSSLEKMVLSKLRARVFQTLKFNEAPFYFNGAGAPAVDYERLAIDVLETAVTKALEKGARPVDERAFAAQSLVTFGDFQEGAAALARVKSKLAGELAAARTARDREDIRQVIKVLNTPVVKVEKQH